MELRAAREGSSHFLWDADQLARPRDVHFRPDWWAEQGRVQGSAAGRGQATFVDAGDGRAWVLRHNHRGGWLRDLLTDHYAWLGADRSRVFREWRLLAEMARLDLPVPAPVAARVVRSGLSCRIDLITERVTDTVTLAEALHRARLPADRWQGLGRVLARFHAAGIHHADLNARNILIDSDGRFTLIDFDHSRRRRPGRWQARNLARLRRSLDKLGAQAPDLHFSESDWVALRGGYLQSR